MENETAIQEFCSITACTPDQARFFLESSGWQVETAVQNYYESDATLPRVIEGDDEEEGDEASAGGPMSFSPPRTAPQAPATGRSLPSNPPFGSGGPNVAGLSSGRKDSSKDKKATSSRGAIRTLSDFNKTSGEDSDDDAQEYFTGGEKSGMMVQDPQKGNRVDAIFEQARKMGAQEGPSEASSDARSGRNTFTGVGRTLTGNVVQPGVGATQSQPAEPIVRNITFWRNGFTVDNGPLRRLDDPANAQFLTSISKSECPKELEPAERGTPVHVNLMRKDEDWSPPSEPRNVAFQGQGRTLGSTSTTESISVPIATNQPSQGLVVDDSQPVTSIQLRLSDGTRMVARFNYQHTVADIRNFIDAARPSHSRSYQLQTMGFPPKVLTDLTQTVEAAGLINAVVIQKGLDLLDSVFCGRCIFVNVL